MSNAKSRIPRLGRGLSSLMARPVEVVVPQTTAAPEAEAPTATMESPFDTTSKVRVSTSSPAERAEGLVHLAVTTIRPNPHQPRQRFDEAALQTLADSIRADGLMQPVIVRPAPAGAPAGIAYELVAGERRWRAAQLAGLTHLPSIVRPLDDRQLAEWALIENLQREDLNPIERAEAFQHLALTFQLSHDQVAARVGVDRSSISNSLRLLNLCDDVRQLVREGRVSAGQAKVLAGLADPKQQLTLAQRAVKQDWSVRQIEQTARLLAAGSTPETSGGAKGETSGDSGGKAKPGAIHLADLEQQIGRQLQTRVHVKAGRKKGTGSLTIEFYSIDQFDAILGKLGVQTE